MRNSTKKMHCVFFAVALLCLFSCKKDTYTSEVFIRKQWKVELNTTNNIPAVAGRTDAAVCMLFLMDNNQLFYDIYFINPLNNGDAPTSAKLFLGNAVENGSLLIDLQNPAFNTEREVKGNVTLNAATIASLLSGPVYLQVNSNQQTAGLVRGQIDKTVKFSADVDLGKYATTVNTTATGKAYIRLLSDNSLAYKVEVNGLPTGDGLTTSHLHKTTDNSSVLTLVSSAADFNKAFLIPAASVPVASITADPLYIDVHSQLYPTGLLKGTVR